MMKIIQKFIPCIAILLGILGFLITTPALHSQATVEPEVKGEVIDKFIDVSDLNIDNWDYFYAYSVYQNEIVGMYPDGLYRGDWKITRGQLAVWIAKVIDLPIFTSCYGTFNDVSSDTLDPNNYGWACQYIEAVANAGIMTGYAGGNFSPGSNVSYSALRDIISRARLGQPTQIPPNYSDTVGALISRSQLAAYLSWNFNTPVYLHFSGKLEGNSDSAPLENLVGSHVEVKTPDGSFTFGGGPATLDAGSGEVRFDFVLDYPIQYFMSSIKGKLYYFYVTPPEDSGYEAGPIEMAGAINGVNHSGNILPIIWRGGRKITGEVALPSGCENEANSCIEAINEFLARMGEEPFDGSDIREMLAGLDNHKIEAFIPDPPEPDSWRLVGSRWMTWNSSTKKLSYEIFLDDDPTAVTDTATYYILSPFALDEEAWLYKEVPFPAGQSEVNANLTLQSRISILKVTVIDKTTGQPIPDTAVDLAGTNADFRNKGLYHGLTDPSGSAVLAEKTTPTILGSEIFPRNITINISPPAYTGLSPRTNYPISLTGCVAQNIIVEL